MLIALGVDVEDGGEDAEEDAAQIGGLDAVEMLEGDRRHGEQDEGDDEGIAEGEPVRHLTAMPPHIHRLDVHAEEHHAEQEAVAELLADRDLAVEEEDRQEHDREDAAVDLRGALDIDGVVLGDQELCEHGDRLELHGEAVIRVGEVELTELERVVHRQDHPRGEHHGHDRGDAEVDADIDVFLDLAAALLAAEEQVIEEIERGEDADHVADVEVRDEHERDRDDVAELAAVVDQMLHAQRDQRQEHQTVEPHGVYRLDDHVGAHREEHAEHRGLHGGEALGMLEVDAHGHARGADLAEDHDEQARQDHLARQEHHDQREGAGQIIADDAHESAGEVAPPVVEDALVEAPEGVAQGFKVVDILRIEVQRQHRMLTEGVEPEDGVGDVHQHHRDEEGDDVVPILGDPLLQESTDPSGRYLGWG